MSSYLVIFRNSVYHSRRVAIPMASNHFSRSCSQTRSKEQHRPPSVDTGSQANRTEVSTQVHPLGEKIKENTKTVSYLGVILIGIGVTSALFYTVLKELFSSSSPHSIYTQTFERVKDEPQVQDALGAPIKSFGEQLQRRRPRTVPHTMFDRNGVPHIRMSFSIHGIRNKGTVHLEMKKDTSGKYVYRYLFVQLAHFPHTTIIIEDNRLLDKVPDEILV